MYDGRDQNPGQTDEDRIQACAQACISKELPVDGNSWKDFRAKGFIVDKSSGRCYCESEDSDCVRDSAEGSKYKRYDLKLTLRGP